MEAKLDYVNLAANALGIPESRVTEPMVSDLVHGLEVMARTPLRYTTAQFLEASSQILAHYKKLLEVTDEGNESGSAS